jgi:hypothetical protein
LKALFKKGARAGRVTQVAECLTSELKALSSNSSTGKRKKKHADDLVHDLWVQCRVGDKTDHIWVLGLHYHLATSLASQPKT